MFCAKTLAQAGWDDSIAQVNLTQTYLPGTVRGMHFQRSPHEEVKLVSCIQGEIWDVAVDLRERSPTFLQWHAEILSETNDKALLIPKGFAHGFQVKSSCAKVLYFHSEYYCPDFEAGLNPRDPSLKINWPMKITQMSERDANFPLLNPRTIGGLP